MTVCDSPTPGDDLLASMDEKLQIVRDRVRGVAEGHYHGLYLWGEGGTSKSFTIEGVLRSLGTPYKLTNSKLTAKGLLLRLEAHPDAVHLIEDAERMFADDSAVGVLRSALWGQVGADGRRVRPVNWITAHEQRDFVFTGGVIVTANCPLADLPLLRALKTRLRCLHYSLTDAEVAAKMRDIARRGHRNGPHELSPAQAREVADAVIERSARLGRRLDLRLLVNAMDDRLQWEAGAAELHWHDLLDSLLEERVVPSKEGGVRAARKADEHKLLQEIRGLPRPARYAAWRAATGKSETALYNRLAELERGRGQDSRIQGFSEEAGKLESAG